MFFPWEQSVFAETSCFLRKNQPRFLTVIARLPRQPWQSQNLHPMQPIASDAPGTTILTAGQVVCARCGHP